MSFIYPVGLPIALSLTAYNAFLTGLIVLLKRKDKAGFCYFVSSVVILLWGIGISFQLHNQLPKSIAEQWGTFAQAVALFIPITWLRFVVVYAEQEEKWRNLLKGAYLLTALLFPFVFTKSYVAGFREMVGVSYPIAGWAYQVFTVFFAGLVLCSFWIFYSAHQKTKDPDRRKDYRWVCFASLYGFTMGSLAFLPVYGVNFPQYNLLVMPLWQILLAYAMIRHRAFEYEEMAKIFHREKMAALGSLTASITHEIKNPLFIARGIAETKIENFGRGVKVSSAESRLAFEKVQSQIDRAMEIMRHFSSFAKRSLQEISEMEAFRIEAALIKVHSLLSYETYFQNIHFIKEEFNNLPLVYADRLQIEEVLFNLMTNACQAMENGGVLTVRAVLKPSFIVVDISDTGAGVSKEMQKKIFDPFFSTKKTGSGLGLYIVKRLIENNKGKIEFVSELQKGTTFKVYLPVKQQNRFNYGTGLRGRRSVPINNLSPTIERGNE